VSVTVGIVADLAAGNFGGVSRFAEGLLQSLLAQPGDGLRYVLFLADDRRTWPDSQREDVRAVPVGPHGLPHGWRQWVERLDRYGAVALCAARGDLQAARIARLWRARQRRLARALACSPWKLDVLHFPFQDVVPTRTRFIYSPWDLQHIHLGDMWPAPAARARDALFRRGCRRASCVVLASEWSREDVIRQYGVPREKTALIPVAAPTRLTRQVDPEFCSSVRAKYQLPRRFAYCPGATWKHKNHIRVVSALAKVSATAPELELHLVCSGLHGRNLDEILDHAGRLGVRGRVRFLGRVEPAEVRALYRLAEFCVYASLFDGAGLPVLEAFEEGCPLAASNATSIPEYAGDAAVLFDPWSVDSIAGALLSLAKSESLRRELAARGRERARSFSWEQVATDYNDLYRRVANAGGS